ncbi:MAG: tRNA pseudouridine(55) synthase TruB [Candidatus Izemoplasmatales bacterium]|jgi:tRNA pseudouridine55 synthase
MMDGILLVDKPYGMTSHDVVFKIRKAIGESRIGHTGTLDPIATGVLVLCLGKATKLVKYFTEHEKSYVAEVAIGYETDTFDATGKVTNTKTCLPLSDIDIDHTLSRFLGVSKQYPPAYSAIKVDGKKLYEYARLNQSIPYVEPRTITIDEINRITPIQNIDGVIRFSFSVKCSKGTYIRVICHDLGKMLNSYGTMLNLRRTSVGVFDIASVQSFAEVIKGNYRLLDPLPFLHMPTLVVNDNNKTKVLNGAFLDTKLFSGLFDTIIYDSSNTPLAIYGYDEQINLMRLSVMLI